MNIRSVEKVNELFKKTLDETQEFIVEGYCSYGNSRRTNEYRYSSLVDENCKFKIDLLEGEEELINGVFYILKVRFYPRKGTNEFRLKVIEILNKFENKLLITQDFFTILKSKIDKGYVNIDNYLKNLIKTSNKVRLGIITFRKSVALEDIFTSIEKEHKNLVSTIRYNISIENFKSIFFKLKNSENEVDLWVISRGGGDLTFFNSLELLKEISVLNKPILTALGHSTDKTLSDLCSDRYFETPTALGNYLNQTLKNIYLEEEKEKYKYKEYQNLLSKKNELEVQVNILKNEISVNKKFILSQNKELTSKLKEIESLKKLLEKSLLNNEDLKKINTILESMCSSTYLNYSFNFVSSLKNLSYNTKLFLYIICILFFTKIMFGSS